MNWYKELKKISQAFGTAPFGSSYLSDKSRSSPWGHAGGDEKTGIFEPSSGKHHANDYMSEEGQQSLVEKELEELKKKKNKKRKDLLLKKLRNKKKAQLDVQDENYKDEEYEEYEEYLKYWENEDANEGCVEFDKLSYQDINTIIENLKHIISKPGSGLGSSSHKIMNAFSSKSYIEFALKDCPDTVTPCDIKLKCSKSKYIQDYIKTAKQSISSAMKSLYLKYDEALNMNEDNWNKSLTRKYCALEDQKKEYASIKNWYKINRKTDLASIDSMPKEVLAEIMNRLAARLEEGKTKKANGLRGLLSFMPTLCASKNIKTASSIKESYNEAYSLFLKNAKIEIDKGLAILHKESQWGQSGPKMPTWRDSDWVTDTYHDIMGDGKGSEKGKELEPQKKQPKEQPKEQPVMEFLLKSTVTVNSVSESMQEIGSAFFIGKNLLLTCAHVVSGGTSAEAAMTIRFNHQEHEGIIIASDPLLDVAVISIKDKTFDSNDYLKMGDSGNLSPGEKIFTVGTPLGFENVVGEGIVSSTPVEYNDVGGNKKYMFISSNINPGNSGGPVIRQSDGTVIGIAAAVINTEEAGNAGLNAAIPIDDIKVFLRNNAIDFGETQNAV